MEVTQLRVISRLKEPILVFLALCFLLAFSVPAFNSNMSLSLRNNLDRTLWVIWAIFILDFLFEFRLAADKKNYLIRHWFDVLALIFPFFRPLRLMRLLSFGSLVLSKFSVAKSINITAKVAITAIFVAYISAVQMTITERSIPNSNIKSFPDAIWWALTTVTTVGYGDRFPVSTTGRIIAFILMVMGISLVGVITANVAAWFVRMNEN